MSQKTYFAIATLYWYCWLITSSCYFLFRGRFGSTALTWAVTGRPEALRWHFLYLPTSSARLHPTTWLSWSWKRLPAAQGHAVWSLLPPPSWMQRSSLRANGKGGSSVKRIWFNKKGTRCNSKFIYLHYSICWCSNTNQHLCGLDVFQQGLLKKRCNMWG